ncbi:GNAT family N-acetyltransferase [candidate division WOR-3 bacterium]|nr:GNAT family N-acetyltransferase [candidate division WOR-3 bacterium]
MSQVETNGYFWEGKLVRLRPMKRQDLELWLEEDVDSEGVRCLSYGVELPKSKISADKFAEQYADFNNSEKRILFSIETLDGKLVGGINIHTMNKKNGTFETGTRIYRKYRGLGYADDAKRIILRYAFGELRFQKYNIKCIETNEGMKRHAKRLGVRKKEEYGGTFTLTGGITMN